MGSGAYGDVFEAKVANSDEPQEHFAVKIMEFMSRNDTKRSIINNELKALQDMDHPNIVSYYHSFMTNNQGFEVIVRMLVFFLMASNSYF